MSVVGTLDGCSRSMAGGPEIRVLDGPNTWSLICPGYESSARSAQFIRRWGLLRESDPGATYWCHGDMDWGRLARMSWGQLVPVRPIIYNTEE
jgi:hypothetical protein